jgi:hypothetical protein
MGLFGTFVYSDGTWRENTPTGEYLRIDIHDSDIATVDYRPAGIGHGRFYLGSEPRHYFESPDENERVDAAAETAGFIAWADRVAGVALTAAQLSPLFADPAGAEPEDIFVEDTVVRLLRLLGLPLPADLEIST